MGISPAIFNSAGQRSEHLLPGTYSRSNNVTSPSGVSTGNLCILGASQGGEPGKLLTFSSLAEARETLISGNLLNAIAYAFNAHDTYIPQRVNAIRVNTATKSELTLKSGGKNCITVNSWDWGVHCNQLKLQIIGNSDGSTNLTIAYKDDIQSSKNIIKPSLAISYFGDGTSSVTVAKDKITFAATNEGQPVEDASFELSFEDFTTIDELVSTINDNNNYNAVNKGNSSDLSSALDTVTKAVTEDTIFYSNYAAFIEALNSSTLIGDVIITDATIRNVPDSTDGYVYFTGGSNQSPTAINYTSALDVLQTENIQIIATPSSDADVISAIATHCKEMSNVINRKERTCILGAAVNASDDESIAFARELNSKYVSYVTDSALATNPITGKTETISGAMIGVMLAAMESSMNVNEPLTFKTLNVLGFTNKRTISNIETLISNGILVCNPNPENLSSYICIRGITTYQADDLINCERSMVREDLFMNRDLRSKFNGGIGHPNDPSVNSVIQCLKNAADDWSLQGLIIKNGSDNVWNIKVRISGDKVYLTYSRYLTAPRNFVFITATNHIYETTVEL